MRVLFISSEVAPFSKTGGLADVAGALPKALRARGVDVLTVSPLWPQVSRVGLKNGGPLALQFPFGTIAASVVTRDEFAFIEQDELFDREGHLYGHADDARRFAAFSMAALAGAQRLGFTPDVVHAHDWPSALSMLALARGFSTSSLKRAKSVFTIHNLAYSGSFPKDTMGDLGLPWELFTPEGVEFHDHLSFLKAGIVYADAVTTVSPTYAKEIQTATGGQGLDGLLRKRAPKLRGILNGIDIDEWNPSADRHLAARFSADDLKGKEACARALLDRLHLKYHPKRPALFGVVSRLADQKGIELLIEALPGVLDRGAQAVVVGTGEPHLVHALEKLGHRHPGALHVHIGFDEALAHQVEAGADFFVMPSKYEPCGLNQMYSLRYGTVPIVRAVGGLEDTVIDLGAPEPTGIKFLEYTTDALFVALDRALALYADRPRLDEVRRRGMRQDFSWAQAAAKYEQLYAGVK